MTAFRALSTTHRRLLLALMVCALAVRALVPAGWMPMAGQGGIVLSLCSGSGPQTVMVMPGMAHDQLPPKHDAGHEQPCSFAAATVAMMGADVSAPIFPPAARAIAFSARPLVAIGRGLAAPPPPQTGPPSLT